MSSLIAAKHLKQLTSYSEGELLAGLTSMTQEEQDGIKRFTEKLVDRMETIDTTKFKKRSTQKKRATNKEIFSEMLHRIKEKISVYESSDQVDRWTINFSVGLNYETMSAEDIATVHHSLVESCLYVEQTRLLIYSERGHMYERLKFSATWKGCWTEMCVKLDICSSTAKRYIDFYNLISAFPRLLICGINFETLMNFRKSLLDYLDDSTNEALSFKLRLPIRNTLISAGMSIESNAVPHGGEVPTRSLCKDADWKPGWEISDNILKKQSTSLDSDSNEESEEMTDLADEIEHKCNIEPGEGGALGGRKTQKEGGQRSTNASQVKEGNVGGKKRKRGGKKGIKV